MNQVDNRPVAIRILVVDDREENLTAMKAVLDDLDYEVVEASSGSEALNRAADHDFAVILLDVQMPGMDGFETARRLRQMERSRVTPIIFVTAIHRSESYELKGYGAGAVDFLFKPIDTHILQAKVAVFADLERKTHQIQRQAELLKHAALKEQENTLLREQIASRDEFLSIASHEMKTPITPLNLQIQTFIQMLKDGALQDVPRERMVRMLQTSQAQIDRLSRLIDELIDITRIKQGKLELQREPVEFGALVQKTLQSFADEFRKQGCDVSFTCAKEVNGFWDPFRIDQVIVNLVTNAAKYGAGSPVEVHVHQESDRARLRVRDHGIGIPELHQKRIFERFERAVSSKNYGGLGLGLYIARHIVELHGGSISVRSQAGKGAEFTVELPLSC